MTMTPIELLSRAQELRGQLCELEYTIVDAPLDALRPDVWARIEIEQLIALPEAADEIVPPVRGCHPLVDETADLIEQAQGIWPNDDDDE